MRPIDLTMIGTLLLAALSVTGISGHAEEPKRPNVVLIIADDMAWDDCGAFGNPKIRTPNIDRLARDGHAVRPGLRHGQLVQPQPVEPDHRPLPPQHRRRGAALAAAARAGHVRREARGRRLLDRRRRQVAPGQRRQGPVRPGAGGRTRPASSSRPGKDAKARDDRRRARAAAQSGCDQWVPVLRDRPKDKPFFLWLAALDPHRDYQPGAIPEPHRPEDVVVPPYLPDVPEVRKDLALYYDEIGRLDRYVGEVLAELDRQGVAEDTLVLFLSDNGRPFPRCKTTLYDSGIRTPLIARWPGHVGPGRRCVAPGQLGRHRPDAPEAGRASSRGRPSRARTSRRCWRTRRRRSGTDLRRAELARLRRPRPGGPVRAVQVHPERRPRLAADAPGRRGAEPDLPGDASAPGRGQADPGPAVVLREPRPAEELYDVEADPHELHNLAGDPRHAEVLAEMRRGLGALGPRDRRRRPRQAEPRRVRPRDRRPAAQPGPAPAHEEGLAVVERCERTMSVVTGW